MKVAVIDPLGNLGGGSRVVESLLPAMKATRPDIEIVFFGNPASMEREGQGGHFLRHGIVVRELKTVRLASRGVFGIGSTAKLMRSLQKRAGKFSFLPSMFSLGVNDEIERAVKGFDLAYFPWPFLMECPRLDIPMVGTFHDFNFRYFFGSPIFGERQLEVLNQQMPVWLERAIPVVSTNFMAGELRKFYPGCRRKISVVHLAPLLIDCGIDKEEAARRVRQMGVRQPYILYPTNLSVHKNIGPLLSAVSILEGMGHDISLVLTGARTESATGRACPIGVMRDFGDPNVLGLGYVTNEQMDALLRCASAVVSTSLYEAGNGPGLDAWARGVPVVMSRIPPFLEHTEVQGVTAELIDPRRPEEIAAGIHAILSNPEKAREDARRSLDAIRGFTWSRTADGYIDVFDEAMRG